MKTLKCRDAGYDCDWETSSNDENEILRRAEEHARQRHGMTQMDQKTREKIQSSIREAPAA